MLQTNGPQFFSFRLEFSLVYYFLSLNSYKTDSRLFKVFLWKNI